MEWISVKDKLPENNGKYLVVYQSPFVTRAYITIKSYASNLYEVDDFDFFEYKGMKHGGWYDYDSEYGYCECFDNSITHWMSLPPFPHEIDDSVFLMTNKED